MGESTWSSEDQNSEGSAYSKGLAQEASIGNTDSIGSCTLSHVCYALENFSIFCSHPEILQETEIKSGQLINLAEEISRHPNVEIVAWIL